MAFLLGALGGLSGSGLNPGTMSPFLQNMQTQSYTQKNMQMESDLNQQNWQKQFSQYTGEFTKYGLPGFMAFSGGAGMPKQAFGLGGTNIMTSGFSGAKMPPITNSFQQYNHWGNPFAQGNGGQAPSPNQKTSIRDTMTSPGYNGHFYDDGTDD